jgi:hypothetical protein
LTEYSYRQKNQLWVYTQFYTTELEWSETRVMSTDVFENMQENLRIIQEQIPNLERRQPKCNTSLKAYDTDFTEYCTAVETLLAENNQQLKRLKKFLYSKERIDDLRTKLVYLNDLKNRNWNLLDTGTIEYATKVIWILLWLKDEIESTEASLFSNLEDMERMLEANKSQLLRLLEPTHEWIQDSQKKKHCALCPKVIIQESCYVDCGEYNQKPKPLRDSEGFLPSSGKSVWF